MVYLGLANELIKEIKPGAICLAEEMSGYPGLAAPVEEGGLGFTHRMAMGTPDYWIKIIKELPDEKWDMGNMFYELTRKRAEEKTVGYAESHDQALVGDKTIIFRLLDKEMYTSMSKHTQSLVVDRGIALHKMIRLITLATAGNGYLNFMGNEFGHPEWIDFPRMGNNWSYHYARRQWSLVDNHELKYHLLADFDKDLLKMVKKFHLFDEGYANGMHTDTTNQILAFERSGLLFVFNFNPSASLPDYGLACRPGIYTPVLSTDRTEYGGFGRIEENRSYRTVPEKTFFPNYMLKLYLPARTAMVLRKEAIRSVHGKTL
jgi:1,4-alpha-glucan branching enzyme